MKEKENMTYQEEQKALSRKWICLALVEIMKEKPFVDISITEIAQKAGVSRRTCYRLFSNKDDMLSYNISLLLPEFLDALKRTDEFNVYNLTLGLFEFFDRHKDFFQLLHVNHLEFQLFKFLSVSTDLYHDNLLKNIMAEKRISSTATSLLIAFFAGGYLNLLFFWMCEDVNLSPEEVAKSMEEAFSAVRLRENS